LQTVNAGQPRENLFTIQRRPQSRAEPSLFGFRNPQQSADVDVPNLK
jgi:hypothetical protein